LIQLGTDLLTSEDLDQESKENIVQTLSSGIDRLTRLVGQIRQVTLTTARTLPINKSTVNLKKLIEQVLNDFMPEKTGRKLSIKVDLESKIENVLADQTLIHIALKNLISNAIRFTPDNGTITISTKISAARAEISVSDTGIGISESQQKIIFEKFYEVTDSLKHSSGNLTFMSCGLGLGLSAVKAILEAHSSNVLVKSEVENGSTFSFRLELANQNLSTVKPENNCTSDVKGRVCSDDNSDKKRKR
jgi:signal transduction histidine kinase